ncbi:Regulator of phospholipase D SRF1 [Pyrenophora seminiperda CCB06]|uniref:Regulator of phospholipase D SRF1 n=1 Tax=Pyrenophora seminiperda CCB06 TaxID=1302712 RepID=A0A3M7MBI4_9PLEO|nr:Regulator of phospholipase D SRF1 [Pyrenophora seminiperda CCB06]
MASNPMGEHTTSDTGHGHGHGHGSPNDTHVDHHHLRPDAAQQQSPTLTSASPNRLLPSPIPPPTASSLTYSLHRPQSRVSAQSGGSKDSQATKDSHDGPSTTRKSHSHSVSSTPRTLASSHRSTTTSAENRERQRAARSLPPWVQSADDDEEEGVDATAFLLPRTPSTVRHANHNFCPTPKSNVPGRKFDHAREGAPVTLSTPVSDSAPKWKNFTAASNHERPISSRGQIVDDDWLKENMPDLEQKWEPIDQDSQARDTKGFWLFTSEKRKRGLVRFHNTIMNHPMVPALVRAIVLIFSILALSLACSIYRHSNKSGCNNNSSTWMAMLVDIVAVLYTVYITYDEYTSKPLGLRSHNAKMSLIFLDLAFIVFESANLSLAFQALTDEKWACVDSDRTNTCPYRQSICERQKGLTATLFIALIAWIATFAISTLRLIHRVAR